MPASEIDDIFAAKGKFNPTPSTSKLQDPASKKEKKQKKRKRAAQVQADQQPPSRTAPETVIDPSLRLSVPTKQRAKPEADDQPEKKRRKSQTEDEERFKDSKGTGPSMFSPVDVPICLYHAVPQGARQRKDSQYTKRTNLASEITPEKPLFVLSIANAVFERIPCISLHTKNGIWPQNSRQRVCLHRLTAYAALWGRFRATARVKANVF